MECKEFSKRIKKDDKYIYFIFRGTEFDKEIDYSNIYNKLNNDLIKLFDSNSLYPIALFIKNTFSDFNEIFLEIFYGNNSEYCTLKYQKKKIKYYEVKIKLDENNYFLFKYNQENVSISVLNNQNIIEDIINYGEIKDLIFESLSDISLLNSIILSNKEKKLIKK